MFHNGLWFQTAPIYFYRIPSGLFSTIIASVVIAIPVGPSHIGSLEFGLTIAGFQRGGADISGPGSINIFVSPITNFRRVFGNGLRYYNSLRDLWVTVRSLTDSFSSHGTFRRGNAEIPTTKGNKLDYFALRPLKFQPPNPDGLVEKFPS